MKMTLAIGLADFMKVIHIELALGNNVLDEQRKNNWSV
jgi:hypothetical protein